MSAPTKEPDVVLAAIERERQRIGNNLHEKLCQSLTALSIQVALLARRVKAGKSVDAEFEQLAHDMQNSIVQAHAVSLELRSPNLAGSGLLDALKLLASETSRESPCEFSCEAPVSVHDAAAALALLRIAEEAVRNAVKHGEPRSIRIALSQTPRAITLKISDDGQGFVPVATEPEGVGGTALMHRHARAARIKLKISSAPGKGTVVSCVVAPRPQRL